MLCHEKMFISRVKAQRKSCEYQDRKYGDSKRSKQERINEIKAKLMWKLIFILRALRMTLMKKFRVKKMAIMTKTKYIHAYILDS